MTCAMNGREGTHRVVITVWSGPLDGLFHHWERADSAVSRFLSEELLMCEFQCS